MALRPRLLATSLAVAAILSVLGGWALARVLSSDDPVDAQDSVVLDVPGEYDESSGELNASNPGVALPDVVLVDGDGTDVSTSSLVGTPLVLNLWYSTCAPCRRELADFAAVDAELAGAVRFVGVNPLDDASTMTSFAGERGVRYELLSDPSSALVDALGVTAFPATVFVAADGTIVLQTGVLTADELRAHVAHVF
jgi:peroxiredoxin